MGVTIHYRLPPGPPRSTRPPATTVAQPMLKRALDIATKTLKAQDIPHEVESVDDRDKDNLPHPALYGFIINTSGPGDGAESLFYGWEHMPDPDSEERRPPYIWSGYHFCKTEFARDFPKVHVAIATIVEQWHQERLISSYTDEAGYLPEHNMKHLMGEDTQHTPLPFKAADQGIQTYCNGPQQIPLFD